MNAYSIALFAHILGALGFFASIGLEWTSIRQLRKATGVEQVREWMQISQGISRLAMPSMIVLLIAGLYMMLTVWGLVPWILIALATIVPMSILVSRVSGTRMVAIQDLMREDGIDTSSPQFFNMLQHPLIWLSIQIRVFLALGIVFLMTFKPDLLGSLLTISIATVLGIISALPIWKVPNTPKKVVM